MKYKICILTANRSEYSLLKPIIQKLSDHDVRVVATGAHVSKQHGYTCREIEKDGIAIDEKIEILLSSDSATSVSKAMGLALIGFSEYFQRSKPDCLIVLGDRYETMAVSLAAVNSTIPIFHFYGGEITEGAIDDSLRHAITKLSYLHFTATETYRNRVIQLGEDPERVYNIGAIGVENIMKEELHTRNEILQLTTLPADKPYVLGTFHSVTLEAESTEVQIQELIRCCADRKELSFLFTMANPDLNGALINSILFDASKHYENIFYYESLGMKKYLSAMKHCEFVIGNSSSGIIETPSFKVPTINIGNRQKGRVQATSVINCEPNYESIDRAINIALSEEFRFSIRNVENPYEKDNTSGEAVSIINDFLIHNRLSCKKTFFDVGANT